MERSLNDLKEKTSSATKWSGITEMVVRCISPFINMILARLLTPEAFGVVATVTMITSFADIFTDAGFQKYLVQHEFDENEDIDEYTDVAFWTNMVVSFLLWLLLWCFSEETANIVGNSGLGDVIVAASATIPLIAFSSIQMARLKRNFAFRSLFFIRVITLLAPILITIPIAYLYRSFWALIIGNIAHCILNAIVLYCYSTWKPKFFYNFTILRKMFSYSWWILLESISVWITSYVGVFIVGIFLNSYYVGVYKTSMTTVNQIMSLITAATSMPLFVALSRLQNNDKEMVKVYRYYIQSISVLVVPIGVGIWLYSDFITVVLLGEQWIEASSFIGLWGLMSSISLVLGTYCNGYFNAKGKTYLSFTAQILHLIVLIPAIWFGVQEGYEVLYEVRSLVRLQFVAVELLLMWYVLQFPVFKLVKDLIPAIISSSFLMIIATIMKSIETGFLWQLTSILLCVVLYMAFMRICFKDVFYTTLNAFGISKINSY